MVTLSFDDLGMGRVTHLPRTAGLARRRVRPPGQPRRGCRAQVLPMTLALETATRLAHRFGLVAFDLRVSAARYDGGVALAGSCAGLSVKVRQLFAACSVFGDWLTRCNGRMETGVATRKTSWEERKTDTEGRLTLLCLQVRHPSLVRRTGVWPGGLLVPGLLLAPLAALVGGGGPGGGAVSVEMGASGCCGGCCCSGGRCCGGGGNGGGGGSGILLVAVGSRRHSRSQAVGCVFGLHTVYRLRQRRR